MLRAIDQGRGQCGIVGKFPDDRELLLDHTERRFTAPGHPEGFGREKAERILDAVGEHLRP